MERFAVVAEIYGVELLLIGECAVIAEQDGPGAVLAQLSNAEARRLADDLGAAIAGREEVGA
jgi:hypothetical protein